MKRKIKYADNELQGLNLEEQDFNNCEFYKCNLSGTRFYHCNLQSAHFIRCFTDIKTGYVIFDGANLQKSIFEGCEFPYISLEDASLEDSKLIGCQFPSANLAGCNLDNTYISRLKIPHAKLFLASFRNSRIIDLTFEPAHKIGLWRIFKIIWNPNPPQQGTIFTSGTELSSFIYYCTKQYRLEQLLTELSRKSVWQRLPYILLLIILGIVSDFGNSIRRWFVSCCTIVIVFGMIYYFLVPNMNLVNSIYYSLAVFLNTNSLSSDYLKWVLLSEGALGYLMLGVLTSVLTTKFFQRW